VPIAPTPAPDVEIERSGEEITVRWWLSDEHLGGDVVVELAVGSPDAPAERRVIVPPTAAEITFAGVATHPRPWVRLSVDGAAHVLAGERRLPVPGTFNFRDLGGYPATDGRRTVWGRVFRSDNFGEVTPDTWRQLHEMGLREVFDLRHDAERVRDPSGIPDDISITVSTLGIGGEAAEAPDVVELLASGGDNGFGLEFMLGLYQDMVADHGAVFATLLNHLADDNRLPAVFHCTAGKDRTGLAAALLLRVLGVDRELVLDDYELSTRYRSNPRIEILRPRLEAAGVDIAAVRPFLSAPRPALEGALDTIDRQYGTAESFLVAHGLEADTPAHLRNSLLTALS
jgi:protein-tyrosine phosphatase